MKIINFGSLNIDRVYTVDHLVNPGETLNSKKYAEFAGGKGLNQSIALSRAGAMVVHAGKIGHDGLFLKELLDKNGADTSSIFMDDGPTGHAVIQVDANAENSILLFGGANQLITENEIKTVLDKADHWDWILLQNEISQTNFILKYASEKKLTVVFNPAPMTPDVLTLPLETVDWLIINEVEGKALTGHDTPEAILSEIITKYPQISVILTIGKNGVHFANHSTRHFLPAETVKPVDTTGAGDTFTGFFLSELIGGTSIVDSLITANRAAAICVTRQGAADSIPFKKELL